MLSKLLIEKTKHGSKTIRLWDGRGMYLEISPKGGKWSISAARRASPWG